MPWPPRLVKGHGVCRWEATGAQSILEIPYFKGITIDQEAYTYQVTAIERNPGHPQFGNEISLVLGDMPDYSPSALQKFSPNGWLELDCGYKCEWRILKQREVPGKEKSETGEDTVLFWRWGWRPDHLDMYYNWGPYAGLHWE